MFALARLSLVIFLLITLTNTAIAADDGQTVRSDLDGDPLPPGAVARLGSLRFRFGQPIFSLAFSPDGKRLAGCSSRQILVWDAATGKRLHEFKFDTVDIRLVRFTAEGKILALATDNPRTSPTHDQYLLLRPEVEQKPIRLPFMAYRFSGLTLSPDGKRIAFLSFASIEVWDLAEMKRLQRTTINWHTASEERQMIFRSFLSELALPPDQWTAATINLQTKAILLVDLRTLKTVQKLSDGTE